jgi:uncharacterized LabA/DUF88 family protein
MTERFLCRIGTFYDGSYFNYAQKHFFYTRKLGWLDVGAFQSFLETYVQTAEPGFASYKIVYGAWFQGLHDAAHSDDKQRYRDRVQHHDLMHAGIAAKYLPMSKAGEKGVDVAFAIDALQSANDGKIDVAALVTGDGDMVPLARALMERGVRVLVAHFDYDDGTGAKGGKSYGSDRLLRACTYRLNINGLETDEALKGRFRQLFRGGHDGPEPG